MFLGFENPDRAPFDRSPFAVAEDIIRILINLSAVHVDFSPINVMAGATAPFGRVLPRSPQSVVRERWRKAI